MAADYGDLAEALRRVYARDGYHARAPLTPPQRALAERVVEAVQAARLAPPLPEPPAELGRGLPPDKQTRIEARFSKITREP